jgi:hypothetical protein
MIWTKRHLALLAAPLTALFLLTGPAAQQLDAQVALGPQGNWGSEADFGVGGRVLVNIPNVNLEFVGSADMFFPEGDVDWLDLNANLFYHIHLVDTPVIPYLGGGLNVARLSNGVSTTEAGLNLGGGLRFPGASLTPFVEARAVISDADQFVLTAGILFGPTRFP